MIQGFYFFECACASIAEESMNPPCADESEHSNTNPYERVISERDDGISVCHR